MRRVALLATLLLAALGAAGCAGADGQRAQEILAQSDQALAQVETFRFSGRMSMEMPTGSFTFTMTGAGRQTGTPASVVTMRADGVPEFPQIAVVTRGDVVWTKMGSGAWVRSAAPAGQATGLEQFDFTQYVKDVDVDEGHDVAGEPAVKLTGVLDTGALVAGMLGQLGALAGGDLSQMLDGLGDTRVVLYVSERSHLPLRTLVDMTIEAAGQQAEMHLDFAITGVNEPVKIPQPRG